MNLFLLFLGILILITVSIDILTTILKLSGGGYFSNWISKITWRIFKKAGGNKAKSRILNYGGVSILVLLFVCWVGTLWLGYSLVYLSNEGSVEDTSSGEPANLIGKIYYVGYNLTSSLDVYLQEITGEVEMAATKSPVFEYQNSLNPDRFSNNRFNLEVLENIESRRKTLNHIISNDGWTWYDVVSSPSR